MRLKDIFPVHKEQDSDKGENNTSERQQEISTAEKNTRSKINFKKARCAIDTEQLHLVKFRLCEHLT